LRQDKSPKRAGRYRRTHLEARPAEWSGTTTKHEKGRKKASPMKDAAQYCPVQFS